MLIHLSQSLRASTDPLSDLLHSQLPKSAGGIRTEQLALLDLGKVPGLRILPVHWEWVAS